MIAMLLWGNCGRKLMAISSTVILVSPWIKSFIRQSYFTSNATCQILLQLNLSITGLCRHRFSFLSSKQRLGVNDTKMGFLIVHGVPYRCNGYMDDTHRCTSPMWTMYTIYVLKYEHHFSCFIWNVVNIDYMFEFLETSCWIHLHVLAIVPSLRLGNNTGTGAIAPLPKCQSARKISQMSSCKQTKKGRKKRNNMQIKHMSRLYRLLFYG